MTCPAPTCTRTVWVLLLWPPPSHPYKMWFTCVCDTSASTYKCTVHTRNCATWATGVTAVSIPGPRPPMFPVITVPWILYGHIRLRRNKKRFPALIKHPSVLSKCAVSRAASSFHTCACWLAVMGHSDRCYQTFYHWFLSSLFPFVHLYSFDTRGILRRGVPCFPYVIYFASWRFVRLRKEAQNLVRNLRAARRTRVECF